MPVRKTPGVFLTGITQKRNLSLCNSPGRCDIMEA